jgi:hypothetical protein
MMFKGRYITRNGTLVAVHLNPGATKGDRVERYIGHHIPMTDSKVCWNENGECVWIQDKTMMTTDFSEIAELDLMEACTGEKFMKERGIRVSGCKECEG